MEGRREPEEVCTPVSEDVELLGSLERDAATVVYVGSVRYEGAYKDMYIVVMPDRSAHVVEVRRLCYEV